MHSQKSGPGYLYRNKKTKSKCRTYHTDTNVKEGKKIVHYEVEKFMFTNDGIVEDEKDLEFIGFID